MSNNFVAVRSIEELVKVESGARPTSEKRSTPADVTCENLEKICWRGVAVQLEANTTVENRIELPPRFDSRDTKISHEVVTETVAESVISDSSQWDENVHVIAAISSRCPTCLTPT